MHWVFIIKNFQSINNKFLNEQPRMSRFHGYSVSLGFEYDCSYQSRSSIIALIDHRIDRNSSIEMNTIVGVQQTWSYSLRLLTMVLNLNMQIDKSWINLSPKLHYFWHSLFRIQHLSILILSLLENFICMGTTSPRFELNLLTVPESLP